MTISVSDVLGSLKSYKDPAKLCTEEQLSSPSSHSVSISHIKGEYSPAISVPIAVSIIVSMSTVERSSDFGTSYLQKLREHQFESYYRGYDRTLLQLVGIAVALHGNDPSSNPPPHLAAWLTERGSILEAGTRLRFAVTVAKELGAAVQALVHARLPTGTQANALIHGGLPDRSNVELFSALAWAVGICIVWYEEIEGELETKIYCRPNEHEWLFYAYMGFDGRKVYCFDHPSLRNHVDESPTGSCFQTSTQPTPIIVGVCRDLCRPPPGVPQPSNTVEIGILKLLVEMAANVNPALVPESERTYCQELRNGWDAMLENPGSIPVFQALGFDLVKKAIDACACDPPNLSGPVETVDSHHLRNCGNFPSRGSRYISHLTHLVHENCLQPFLREKIRENPTKAVLCPVCPHCFSEAFIVQVLPHYQTIKDEAFKLLQQATTKPR